MVRASGSGFCACARREQQLNFPFSVTQNGLMGKHGFIASIRSASQQLCLRLRCTRSSGCGMCAWRTCARARFSFSRFDVARCSAIPERSLRLRVRAYSSLASPLRNTAPQLIHSCVQTFFICITRNEMQHALDLLHMGSPFDCDNCGAAVALS